MRKLTFPDESKQICFLHLCCQKGSFSVFKQINQESSEYQLCLTIEETQKWYFYPLLSQWCRWPCVIVCRWRQKHIMMERTETRSLKTKSLSYFYRDPYKQVDIAALIYISLLLVCNVAPWPSYCSLNNYVSLSLHPTIKIIMSNVALWKAKQKTLKLQRHEGQE